MALKNRRTQNRRRQQNKKRKSLRKNTRKNLKKKRQSRRMRGGGRFYEIKESVVNRILASFHGKLEPSDYPLLRKTVSSGWVKDRINAITNVDSSYADAEITNLANEVYQRRFE